MIINLGTFKREVWFLLQWEQITFFVFNLHVKPSSVCDINTPIPILWESFYHIHFTSNALSRTLQTPVWMSCQVTTGPRLNTHFAHPVRYSLKMILNWAQRTSSSPNKHTENPSENLLEPNVHLIICHHCQKHLSSLQGNHADNSL